MSETFGSAEEHDTSPQYEIRVKGHLDDRWAERFEGLTLSREDGGDTLLTGSVVDQAALHGLLRAVRDLGMPLLSVIHREPAPAEALIVQPEDEPQHPAQDERV